MSPGYKYITPHGLRHVLWSAIMVRGFQCIISFTADSALQASIDTKKPIPLADDGKSFNCNIDAVRVLVTIEFSVITRGGLFCALVAGCGVCKRMQPIFQQAATETKGKYVRLLMKLCPTQPVDRP